MSKPKLTPWFDFAKHQPINGDDNAIYEWRCRHYLTRHKHTKRDIVMFSCSRCQWRGVFKESK